MIDKKEKNNSQPDNGPRVNEGAMIADQPLPSSDAPVVGNLALAPEPSQQLFLADGKTQTIATKSNSAANDTESQQSQQKQKMSPGEKKFNRRVYWDIGYWLNLASSVVIADYFTNPESKGRKSLDKTISRTTQALTQMGVSLKHAHHNSKIGIETLTLLSGGTLLLIPLKIMEDNKRKKVHKLNKELGYIEHGPDGKELGADEIYIEHEQPKQSWGNVIWRRVVGTLAVVGTGLAVDHIGKDKSTILPQEKYDLGFAKVTYDAKVLGGKERITNKVFGLLNKATETVSGKRFNPKGTFGRWTNLAILDSVFTVITAVVMKATNGAKKGKMPKEKDNTNDPKVVSESLDTIITADEIDRNEKTFSNKVERRVNCLIDAKRKDQHHTFAETLRTPDTSVAGLGLGV